MLKGSIVPLVTPFKDGALDEEALRRLIRRQLRAGTHALSVGGSTGEPMGLSLEERKRLIQIAVEEAGKTPVLAGTGTASFRDTLELTRFAQRAGAWGALVMLPPAVRPNQEGIYRYFARLAEEVEGFPLVLYNIPGRVGVEIRPETVQRLRQAYPQVAGLKHSSPDLEYVSHLIALLDEDFALYCGLEALTFPMMALGAVGTIAATANWLPEEVAELTELALSGRFLEARKLHHRLFLANEAVFWDTNPIPLKTVLSWMGLIRKEWRPPLGPTTLEVEARLRAMAERYGLLAASPKGVEGA